MAWPYQDSCEAKVFIEVHVQSGTIARQEDSECAGKCNEVIKARIEEYKMEDGATIAEHLGYLLPFIETSCSQESSNKFHRSLTHTYTYVILTAAVTRGPVKKNHFA